MHVVSLAERTWQRIPLNVWMRLNVSIRQNAMNGRVRAVQSQPAQRTTNGIKPPHGRRTSK